MVGPARFLRALVGASGAAVVAAVLVAGLLPVPSALAADRATPDRALRAADRAPLHVSIDDLAPSYLPRRGTIEITGKVTNVSDETWTTIKLYAVDGTKLDPMRNAAQLAAAAQQPNDSYVGDRIYAPGTGTPGEITQLDPGQSSTYTVTVKAAALQPRGGGVYWFGVQALGQGGSEPRDSFADGRARTFLPYVPARVGSPLPTALIVPLVRDVPYAEDGSLDLLSRWTRSLTDRGRLHDLLFDFAQGNHDVPLTWLVDPSLVDAIGRLADGNPARSLGPDRPAGGSTGGDTGGDGTASPAPTASASPDTGGAATDGQDTTPPTSLDPATAVAAAAATAWLDELTSVVDGQQVLTLPYGDVDVPAAVQHDPELLEAARRLGSTELSALGIDTSPALASPSGYLDAASIQAGVSADGTDGDRTTVIGSDKMFARPAPGLAEVSGSPVVVASAGAAEGGPGPGPALTAVSLRQRILSEAAVRVLRPDARPLVVVLPTDWDLRDAATLFDGLDVGWVQLQDLTSAVAGAVPTPVDPTELVYPPRQEHRELDPDTFAAVNRLVDAGSTLQSLLTRNTTVSGEVTRQALTGASYAIRGHQLTQRAAIGRSRAWVDQRLGSVAIKAPRGVTLSSASGKFAATITNRLDEPVTVGVRARSDADITISQPRQIQLAPHSHTTVILEAHSTSNKVHNVTLMVTDQGGTLLGASDALPIRSAQVSAVIWLIMGTGVVLLFGAIAVRLFRRIAGARRPRLS